MNTKYHSISITPYRRSNFQPFKWVATTRNITVDSKETVEYVKPVIQVEQLTERGR